MSFLAGLAPGYPCPKSESKCGTELFLTLINTKVHQHQKRSALYPQIHQSSWTVLLCSQSLWQMQQACKTLCPTFSSPRPQEFCQCQVSGSAAAASLLGSLECPCHRLLLLALHVTASLLELSAFCFPRTYLLGSLPGSFGDFQTSFYQVSNMFLMSYWW